MSEMSERRDDLSVAVSQQTLEGDELEYDPPECDIYPGCRGDGEYRLVDVLAHDETNALTNMTLIACESCTDEYLEHGDEEKVEEIPLHERWS